MEESTTTRRAVTAWVAWAVGNAVLAFLAIIPLVTAFVLTYYVRAKVWGTVSAPFHEAEASVSVVIILVSGAAVGFGFVWLNRIARRRLGLHGALLWLVAITALLAPSALYIANHV
ncbi:hypothetical protein [Actinokineospora globicatena]|uniref:Uncharacterized protein n=1 Tax=Actinokineospora globicatena TaxID=103729 RepID=A0A9W6QIB1_9PSEU|nr:hypothetical protein [Actinokineospora globicatena]GLW91606.1 hypothetical protein Aglo03_24220 [Actinokineospora globicatena]